MRLLFAMLNRTLSEQDTKKYWLMQDTTSLQYRRKTYEDTQSTNLQSFEMLINHWKLSGVREESDELYSFFPFALFFCSWRCTIL